MAVTARFRISRPTSRGHRPAPSPTLRSVRPPPDQTGVTVMFGYYIRLALKNFRRNPGLTALMVCAMGFGIAVCVMTMTVYHAMSGNPIWWKNDRLYTVTMDNWDPNRPVDLQHPTLPPAQMTYKDATFLMRSKIPEHRV